MTLHVGIGCSPILNVHKCQGLNLDGDPCYNDITELSCVVMHGTICYKYCSKCYHDQCIDLKINSTLTRCVNMALERLNIPNTI